MNDTMPAESDTKGTEHTCVGCGAPQAPCSKCGGTSFRYEPTCDVCHEPIKQTDPTPRAWFRDQRGKVLSVHTKCVGAYDMKCSICGGVANQMGDVSHDMEKHLAAAKQRCDA